MYISLILFVISLAGISLMLVRKISVLKKKTAVVDEIEEELFFDVPDLEEVRSIALRRVKRYGYVTVVYSIRVYIKSKRLASLLYQELKKRSIDFSRRYIFRKTGEEKREVSGFLKMISEYKEKINRIKEEVQKEEGLR